ncbi:MAG: hypothetical protein WCY32_10410 [Burkholderiaceae bacterium]
MFAPWFAGFDPMQPAIYDFTLSAGGANGPISVSMRVTVGEPGTTVVSEPGALGLLLCGSLLIGMQRLRSRGRLA